MEHLSAQIWVGAPKIHLNTRLNTFQPPEIVKLASQKKTTMKRLSATETKQAFEGRILNNYNDRALDL